MNVSRTKLVGVSLAIFAVTVWLHWPCTHGGFLRVDDQEYLRQSVRWHGLTWNSVKWAFTSTDQYYQPLPRLSHVLDYQFWGGNAAGHHATSVVMHACNAALVFGFLWRLLGSMSLSTGERLTVAAGVAVVFAIHPLQTESVAWMAGRTQLLCTMFCIGSIWAYVAGARHGVVWGMFLLAALSKPMAVSLPLVMLAIDYFPLRRHERLGWRRLVLEKVGLIAISAAVVVATIFTTSPRARGSTIPVVTSPLSVLVPRLFESLTYYLVKLVWPSHLSPNYLFDMSVSPRVALASALCVAIITVVVVREKRRMPMLVAGWAAYLLLILPVSGLLPTNRPIVAQRFAYMAILPPLVLAAAAGVWAWRHWPPAARLALVGLLAGELCLFASGTRRLIPDWHNDESLRRATLVEFPDSEQANRELATELLDQGRASEAFAFAQRAVELSPQSCQAHAELGLVLASLGRTREAVDQHEQALRIDPGSPKANFGFGLTLLGLGRVDDAAEHFEQALQVEPSFAQAHLNLGLALEKLGRRAEGIHHYEEALRIDPNSAAAHTDLGDALAAQGRVQEAIAHYGQALQIKPDFAGGHFDRGLVLERVGRLAQAVADYNEALRLEPNNVRARLQLGTALVKLGRANEAIEQFENALQIDPRNAEAHYDLGLTLMDQGRLQDAIGHYEQALKLQPDFADARNDLGVALARAGRVPEAIDQWEQALRIKPEYADAHNNLGIALVRLGKVQEAIGHYGQALRIQPDFARAHYNLGNALVQAGRVQEAIGQYEQALKLQPDFAAARDALARARAVQ